MRLHLMLIALAGCGLPAESEPAPSCEPGVWQHRTEYSGVAGDWLLGVPPDAQDAPIAVFLHGLGGTFQDAGFERGEGSKAFAADALDRGYVVIAPQAGPGHLGRDAWNAGRCCAYGQDWRDDLAFVDAIVDEVRGLSCTADEPAAVVGESNGGMMAWHLACRSEQVGAISVQIGWFATRWDRCEPAGPVPVLQVHGDEDAVLPLSGVNPQGFIATPPQQAFERFVDEHNGCAGAASSSSVGAAACDEHVCAAESTFCLVQGLAHDWPTEDTAGFDGNGLVLDFFDRNGAP